MSRPRNDAGQHTTVARRRLRLPAALAPLAPNVRPTLTRVRREAQFRTVGEPYDRQPCLHALRSLDLIAHPHHPDDPTRRLTRVTESPCTRPGGHHRSDTPAEVLHATSDHRTWQ